VGAVVEGLQIGVLTLICITCLVALVVVWRDDERQSRR
jgi:hypothetical protein